MRFLFFDRVLELEPGQRMLARKQVGMDGAQFNDHFRGRPIMPATLVIECLAQTAGWLNFVTHGESIQMVVALVEEVTFHHQVVPGDALELEARVLYIHPGGTTMAGTATVDGKTVATVERMVFANQAFDRAQLSPAEIDHYTYIKTSTRLGEAMEP